MIGENSEKKLSSAGKLNSISNAGGTKVEINTVLLFFDYRPDTCFSLDQSRIFEFMALVSTVV